MFCLLAEINILLLSGGLISMMFYVTSEADVVCSCGSCTFARWSCVWCVFDGECRDALAACSVGNVSRSEVSQSVSQSINQSIMIFSVVQIVNYYWDHEGVYGETIECEGMICEREMSSAGGGKQLKKVIITCLILDFRKWQLQIYPYWPNIQITDVS